MLQPNVVITFGATILDSRPLDLDDGQMLDRFRERFTYNTVNKQKEAEWNA